ARAGKVAEREERLGAGEAGRRRLWIVVAERAAAEQERALGVEPRRLRQPERHLDLRDGVEQLRLHARLGREVVLQPSCADAEHLAGGDRLAARAAGVGLLEELHE